MALPGWDRQEAAATPTAHVGVIFLAKRGTRNETVFLICTKSTLS